MSSNVVFFGWNRSIPGREQMSAAHFQEFSQYLADLQKKGTLEGFEPVFLDNHGGDLNGFFLLRSESTKLDQMIASTEWMTHVTRAQLHLEGSGYIRGATGAMVMERMNLWTGLLPA
ncbi:MAG: hypothetical protein ACR2GP_14170 [Burkholderiaceae bacterium]